LRDELDELFAGTPQVAGVLRAMLLGDRSFVDREEGTDFQKTGVFHVLVLAGLHVGALAFALYWAGRRQRLPRMRTMLFTITLLSAYVAVVEQRAPYYGQQWWRRLLCLVDFSSADWNCSILRQWRL
jgi:competence protein ComEC